MTDIRELLELAVEDEPLTAFDVDRSLAAGRRRLWRRRITMAGAAVLSVVAVTVAVVSLEPRDPVPAPQPAVQPGPERAAQLTRIVANVPVLPAGMQRTSAGPMFPDPASFRAMRAYRGWNYDQVADLTDAQGSGSLEVNVTADGSYPDCTASSVPGLTCTHLAGPDGADLTVYRQTGDGGWSGTAVVRRLPDGTWASAWTSSLSWTLVKGGWSYTTVGWLEIPVDVKPSRPAPPLPVERLIEIVTAIAAG